MDQNPLFPIEILQTIGTGYRQYSAEQFREDLERVPLDRKTIYLNIDSSGGSLFETYEILALIETRRTESGCSFLGSVGTLAASAASLIYLACDYRTIQKEAVVMIHCPSANVYGNSDDFRIMYELLVESEKEMIQFYSERLPKVDPEVIRNWIESKADYYFNCDECLAMGIADQIVTKNRTKTAAAKPEAKAAARERFNREIKAYSESVGKRIQADNQSSRVKAGLEKSIFPERYATGLIATGFKVKSKFLVNIGKKYLEQARKNR
jgi:ATP-dependent Clp protease protease subunit